MGSWSAQGASLSARPATNVALRPSMGAETFGWCTAVTTWNFMETWRFQIPPHGLRALNVEVDEKEKVYWEPVVSKRQGGVRLQFVTLSHSGFAKLCLANALAQGDSNWDCQRKTTRCHWAADSSCNHTHLVCSLPYYIIIYVYNPRWHFLHRSRGVGVPIWHNFMGSVGLIWCRACHFE